MVRTQIQLTEQQAELLKDISRTTDTSVAAIIRQALDQYLSTRKPDQRALYRKAGFVIGKYHDPACDVAVNHDRYLQQAFAK